MLKGIPLPSSELVDPSARILFSASPVSVSPDGQLAVIDVLYGTDAGQLHAFMLVDLTDGSYLTNYNTIVGKGDETAIKASTTSVIWSSNNTPTIVMGYEDLTDPVSSGKDDRIGMVTGSTLNETDLIEASSNVVSNGSIQNLIIDETGRYVAFQTAATNLSPSGSFDTNGQADVYLIDTHNDTLTRVSALSDGTEAPIDDCVLQDISIIDGKVSVLFSTTAGKIFSASDTNIAADLYLYNEGRISLVSSNSEGSAGGYDAGLAAFVEDEIAFLATDLEASDTDGLLDLYIADTVSLTKRINPVVNTLTYSSDYDLWIEGNNDTDIILGFTGVNQANVDLSNQLLGINTITNTNQLYTLNSSGTLADDVSDTPAISDIGNTVAYRTSATNLASQDSLAFVVDHTNTTPQGTLALLGSVRVGQTIQVDTSSFTDVDGYGSGLSYDWLIDEQLHSSGNSLNLTPSMQGRSLQVKIEYIDDWGVSENLSLTSAIEVGNRGIELKLNGKTLNHGSIIAKLDGTETTIASDSSYFDLQGNLIDTVTLDPAMHTSDINIGDVISSLRHIVGLSPLDGKAAMAADVDNDNTIGIGDVIAQLRHIVGLERIDSFDVVTDNGIEVGNTLQSHSSVELVLNGDVDFSTELLPTFYDV